MEPIETKNLDNYGNDPLLWSRARDLLEAQRAGPEATDVHMFLSTVRPDGRPHTAGIGAVWVDDTFYFVSGPTAEKTRDLAANPSCTIAMALTGLDLVAEGTATRVVDSETLERLAAEYRDQGWPVQVDGDAFTAPYNAPSAGPPPWYLYRMTLQYVHAVASVEPQGATRWTFA